MTTTDPILAARSVAALMQAVDDVYGWHLPTTFPSGTPLATLWGIPITVAQDPHGGVLYAATGAAPYAVGAILNGVVTAQVAGTALLTVAPPTKETAS